MNKVIKRALILFGFIIIYIAVIMSLKIYCPIRYLTGVPCPACGSSRAFIALLNFDLGGYFYYNAFAVPLLLAAFLGLNADLLSTDKKYINVVIIIIAVSAFIYYIYRLYFSLIP